MARKYGFSSLVREFLDIMDTASRKIHNTDFMIKTQRITSINAYLKKYKKNLATVTNRKDDNDITEIAREVKAEINRILQIANRRAQNIEESQLASPAYKALMNELSNVKSLRFTKFTIAGLDLLKPSERIQIVDIYSRALSFINNETSSVRGARIFIDNIASQNRIPFSVANKLIDLITSPHIVEGIGLVVNNWDSERVANMVSEYSESYDNTAYSQDEFIDIVEQQIEDALQNKTGFDTIDIWDL